MKVELWIAIIAGAVSLVSVGVTAWNSYSIESLKLSDELRKETAQRQKEMSKFSEPLARSAYDLQSRFYNILKQGLIDVYLIKGNDREKLYVINNTAYVIAQYMCWAELVRRETQLIDLGEHEKTRELLHLQDSIYRLWGTDRENHVFRVFAGEQRAIGEALIQTGVQGQECMGYGSFLKTFTAGVNPLIDVLRSDVVSLKTDLGQAAERMTNLQHALIDLLQMLDPDYVRFPKDSRSKV